MSSVPRLVISAVRGGLGKTTLALGIIGAWRRQGKRIAPFKKGPDYIDAGWIGAAAETQCYNLDLFLMQEESILRSFESHSAGADVAVIEGNRGLYDGVDETGTFSTARLARLLKAPVILIVDCTKSSSTVAAVVLGCKLFDPDVPLGGVILNNVASKRHETVIRKAIAQAAAVPVLGAVPRFRKSDFPERHLGLTPFQEHPDVDRAVRSAVAVAEDYLDLDALWKLAEEAPAIASFESVLALDDRFRGEDRQAPVIGIIRDSAFQFYYPDNIEALQQQGAAIREINALHDRELPRIDALYIGGGFPETQAAELAANGGFCRSLRQAAENDLPIYAECGGLIYLGRSLRVGDRTYAMTSVLPADFVLEKKPQAHGYTVVQVAAPTPFFDRGSILKGHEFHYSHIVNRDELPPLVFAMQRGHGIDGAQDGILYRKVLATYTHLHAAGTTSWAAGLVRSARTYRNGQRQGTTAT
jgi:cobyrinic acid a,c-diamide synthase